MKQLTLESAARRSECADAGRVLDDFDENTKGALFIVDAGVAKPGTNGVIWVDDVSVY